MAENKTKQTDASVADFLDAVPDAQRRADAREVCAMMERLSGEAPKMWGPSIVGFGRYHYKCGSRWEEMARIGFSPRAKELVLYLADDGYSRHPELMQRLGKHKTGKSCLYIKKLDDVDRGVLEELVKGSLACTRERYPEN